MLNTQFLINYAGNFSYLGIFILIVLSGYVIPVPEEVMLLLAGYIAALGFNNFYFTLIFAIMGVLVGDNILFWLSKKSGSKLIDRLKRKIRKHKLMKYRNLMKNNIGKTIFVLRFIIGLRFFGPFLAGSLKVKWTTFQLYNFLAVAIYVPIIVFLGYYFHTRLALIITGVEITRHLIFFAFILLATLMISIFIRNRYLKINHKRI